MSFIVYKTFFIELVQNYNKKTNKLIQFNVFNVI
jgi:hypothetical protein